MNNDDESNSCIYKNKKFLLIIGLISFAIIIATMVILINDKKNLNVMILSLL